MGSSKSLSKLLGIPGSEIEFGYIKSKRSDGLFDVTITGKNCVAQSTLNTELPTGRRVMISRFNGKRFITGDFRSYTTTNKKTVIIDG